MNTSFSSEKTPWYTLSIICFTVYHFHLCDLLFQNSVLQIYQYQLLSLSFCCKIFSHQEHFFLLIGLTMHQPRNVLKVLSPLPSLCILISISSVLKNSHYWGAQFSHLDLGSTHPWIASSISIIQSGLVLQFHFPVQDSFCHRYPAFLLTFSSLHLPLKVPQLLLPVLFLHHWRFWQWWWFSSPKFIAHPAIIYLWKYLDYTCQVLYKAPKPCLSHALFSQEPHTCSQH